MQFSSGSFEVCVCVCESMAGLPLIPTFTINSLFLFLSFTRPKLPTGNNQVRLSMYICVHKPIRVCVLRVLFQKQNDGAQADGQIRFFSMWTTGYLCVVVLFLYLVLFG